MGAIFLQLSLILINALFACAEIAIISINDNRLALLTSSGDKRATRLSKLTKEPSHFLATIQVGITFAGFLGSAFAATNFSGPLTRWVIGLGVTISPVTLDTIAVVVITFLLSYFTLVFGELIPKRIAMQKAEPLALLFSGFIYRISKMFAPVVWLLTISTNASLRLMGFDPYASRKAVTEEEIRMMVDSGSEKGTIGRDEKDMIQRIFEFDDTPAAEIMTHRIDVIILWMDQTDAQWAQIIKESPYTAFPICAETADHIVGVLYAKDYFRLEDQSRDHVMNAAVRQAYLVPETVRANVLFRNMQTNRIHFAVVLDDYGGMSGIITMQDLLEQLVGDLEDNDDAPESSPNIEQVDTNTWQIVGTAPLDDVSKELGVVLPDDDYDSFGGFVFSLLGAIPEDGSTPEVEAYGLVIKVVEIRDHRLEKAFVYRS